MAFYSLLKAFAAFLSLQIVSGSQNETLEVTYSSACEVCVCGPGPNLQPKELVKCHQIKNLIKIVSLPDFVKGVEIIDAQNGVIFSRGAIRVRDKFNVFLDKVKNVEFQEKSTTIIDSQGKVQFKLNAIHHMKLRSRAVSSASGSFELEVANCQIVDIEGQAFDVITQVQMENLDILNLAPAAFKPNVQLFMQQPFTQFALTNIKSIPILSMEVFSSAHSIKFKLCHIDEIESTAFSGVSVYNVTFDSTSIDKIHTSAFHDRAVLQNLAFVNCSLKSVSEKAIKSGISSLKIIDTEFFGIGNRAFDTAVANVDISHCIFKTLSEKAFYFSSWNQVKFDANIFKFLDQNAFSGISEPNNPSTFYFTANQIHRTNRNGLKLAFNKSAKNITKNNIFYKDCECDLDKWLMIVSGETDLKNPSEWSILLLNSSLCQVPNFAKGCFEDQDHVLLSLYNDKMCSIVANSQLDCSYESPWKMIQKQIQINTNKGILLLVLAFVLASTLLVGIFTLIRWIIYTVQLRKFNKTDADWNFTKIEEKEKIIPEAEIIELEESSPGSSAQHYESLNNDQKEPLLEDVKLPEHATEGKPPPTGTTFYDEMICLLQEKLEDPENYSTVVDDKLENATFYMDPLHMKKT